MKLNLQLFANGVLSLGTSGAMEGQVVWNSTSNGTVANSSNVYAQLYVRRTDSYTTTGTFTGGLNINGVTTDLSKHLSVSSGWVLIGDFSRTVPHNDDGTGTLGLGGWINGPAGTSLRNNWLSRSDSFELDRIPRQAYITGADNFTDESNPNMTYTNPAGNSASSLLACISFDGGKDDVPYRNVSKTGTSYRFNLTDSERETLRKKTPNSNNLNILFILRTVIGGATFYATLNRTMTIVNANPIFTSFNFEDINENTVALTGDNQSVIKGYSNVKITVPIANKAAAVKNATMKSYSFNDIKANYSDTEDVSITANNVTSGTINVLAIDSRGNVTTASKVATNIIDYTPIKITDLSLSRESGVSGNVSMNFNGTWWNGNFGKVANSIKTVTYQIHNNETNVDSVGTTKITPSIKDNNFSFYGAVAGDNEDTKEFDPSASYNITLTVSDEISTYSMTYILGTGIPAISIDRYGIGIFCKYDSSIGGYLQVGGKKIA